MKKVLVIGIRDGIVEELRKRRNSIVLWSEKQILRKNKDIPSIVKSFPMEKSEIKDYPEIMEKISGCQFVISGIESSVVPASIIRRVINARKSKDSVLIRCRDKFSMKEELSKFEIPMTKFLKANKNMDPEEIFREFGTPIVVKKRSSSGSRGVRFVHDIEKLSKIISRNYILEKFVNAPEMSIESFVFHNEIKFVNLTEYYEKGKINITPASVPDSIKNELIELNRRVIRSLKINWGMTHLEVYLTEQGILFGEIALRPPGGKIMDCITHTYGFNSWEAFVSCEIDEPYTFNHSPLKYTAALIFHPEKGKVKDISGENSVKKIEGLIEFKNKLKMNDEVSERNGVGENTGHAILVADTRDELIKRIHSLQNTFSVSIQS